MADIFAPVAAQTQHAWAARNNPQQRFSANHGAPPVAATPRPNMASHPKELPPVERPAAPNTGNAKLDQKYQKQQASRNREAEPGSAETPAEAGQGTSAAGETEGRSSRERSKWSSNTSNRRSNCSKDTRSRCSRCSRGSRCSRSSSQGAAEDLAVVAASAGSRRIKQAGLRATTVIKVYLHSGDYIEAGESAGQWATLKFVSIARANIPLLAEETSEVVSQGSAHVDLRAEAKVEPRS